MGHQVEGPIPPGSGKYNIKATIILLAIMLYVHKTKYWGGSMLLSCNLQLQFKNAISSAYLG